MSLEKYSSIFSRQMEAIVYISVCTLHTYYISVLSVLVIAIPFLFTKGWTQCRALLSFGCTRKVNKHKRSLTRPSHGKLKLANSSWCVWTAQRQSAYKLANCSRQIKLASVLANFFTNFFVLHLYLTCERLANMCWLLSTNQNELYSRDLLA